MQTEAAAAAAAQVVRLLVPRVLAQAAKETPEERNPIKRRLLDRAAAAVRLPQVAPAPAQVSAETEGAARRSMESFTQAAAAAALSTLAELPVPEAAAAAAPAASMLPEQTELQTVAAAVAVPD